ncbi:MAG: hypothetical protein ACI80L_002030 [Pseudohongiellaceae bacterium]|jgi:hypothetical protein
MPLLVLLQRPIFTGRAALNKNAIALIWCIIGKNAQWWCMIQKFRDQPMGASPQLPDKLAYIPIERLLESGRPQSR